MEESHVKERSIPKPKTQKKSERICLYGSQEGVFLIP
jgi:hypothetical protein